MAFATDDGQTASSAEERDANSRWPRAQRRAAGRARGADAPAMRERERLTDGRQQLRHLFRFTTWGESHGPAIGVVVDGVPPRIPLAEADIQHWLDRRRPGQSRYTTQRREPDEVKILSGVFEGQTTGTPIQLMIENVDQRSRDYRNIADRFRPGHADYTYWKKYGIRDYRGGGRASARETASRVAAGAVARKVLGPGDHDPRRAGADRAARDRPRRLGLDGGRGKPVLVPGPRGGGALGRLSRRRAQSRLVGRRGHRDRRSRRAGRARRAGLRQARRRSGPRDDDDQRGQGGRDRRRVRRGRAVGRGKRRRDAHAGRQGRVPVEQCRRHPRRHLDRARTSSCASRSSRPARS